MSNTGQQLLDALLPQQCVLCGLISGRSLALCPDCEAELSPNTSNCERCAIPLPTVQAKGVPDGSPIDEGLAAHRGALNAQLGRYCGNCLRQPPPYSRVIAPWLYSEYLGHIIHRWKYTGDFGMTPLLAELWRQRAHPTPVDLLIPVPLHWRRQWRRGFNQSELLARQLQRTCPTLTAAMVDTQLLNRHRATAVQSGSNAQQRARNLRGAFTVTRRCDNLRIAVIDDVFTTGATATETARALTRAGARHIEIWCLARTPAPGA